ncbi:hypothetical protein C9374_007929 [Naegleria lovaniensis]|uniref:Uncharacterized protein n=1 Tax=Naegleria lovaniensis TaxID=51637 RepID=A0AA88GKC9_NAELO|nr:uncharacterized protein C9374_007929 [Naegleria lovaniensis]KAG2378781.1 hypothetical protein C9374_007929 [Naegleria lovaniensis]
MVTTEQNLVASSTPTSNHQVQFSKYVRKHLKEKHQFEKEKNLIFRYLLEYHYLGLHLMIENNLYRRDNSDSKSLLGIDATNLYLFALKYQKQRLRLKLLYFLAELNFYSNVLTELDVTHITQNSTLITQMEQQIKVHEIMNMTREKPPAFL